jgi:hypothetical protein
MIPLNDVVKVYKGEKRDSWGIVTSSTEPIEYKGMVTYSTSLEELKLADGTKVVVTASIVFKGKVDIEYGDKLGIDDGTGVEIKLDVAKIQPINDLSSTTLFVKVYV